MERLGSPFPLSGIIPGGPTCTEPESWTGCFLWPRLFAAPLALRCRCSESRAFQCLLEGQDACLLPAACCLPAIFLHPRLLFPSYITIGILGAPGLWNLRGTPREGASKMGQAGGHGTGKLTMRLEKTPFVMISQSFPSLSLAAVGYSPPTRQGGQPGANHSVARSDCALAGQLHLGLGGKNVCCPGVGPLPSTQRGLPGEGVGGRHQFSPGLDGRAGEPLRFSGNMGKETETGGGTQRTRRWGRAQSSESGQ